MELIGRLSASAPKNQSVQKGKLSDTAAKRKSLDEITKGQLLDATNENRSMRLANTFTKTILLTIFLFLW